MRTRIEFTEKMNEISGFGGFYERCCRAAVIAGARWLRAHPGAKPSYLGYEGLYGMVIAANDEAKAMDVEIGNAYVARDDGTKSQLRDELTGMQNHAVIHHLLFIADRGWDAYRERMSSPVATYADEPEIENEPAV
jgi:hypothetical protein